MSILNIVTASAIIVTAINLLIQNELILLLILLTALISMSIIMNKDDD